METLNPIFTTYLFDVEIVTPVHVGMAQEKNYVRGLDYVLETNGQDAILKYLNQKNLLERLQERPEDLTGYSAKLAAGQPVAIENFLTSKKLLTEQTILKSVKVQGQPDEIRRTYQTGTGQFVIPGSSLKGAVRSIVYTKLKSRLGRAATDEQMFGKITDNLMRYLQVPDIVMTQDSVKIYGTKVFSADGNPKESNGFGTWKHKGGRGGHRDDFSEKGFSFFYEAIMTKSKSTLPLRLASGLPEKLRQHALNDTPNFDLFDRKSGRWLIDLIRNHTENYLQKEAVFYSKFLNDDLNKLTTINDRIQSLRDYNQQHNSCLLRVGAGVGFHSITGDWQLRSLDHFSDRNLRDHAVANKTRKFTYTFSEQHDDYIFYPMGFIKLTLKDENQ